MLIDKLRAAVETKKSVTIDGYKFDYFSAKILINTFERVPPEFQVQVLNMPVDRLHAAAQNLLNLN